jgi:glycosyltransferase involved in cell wall biosynthesis
MEKGCEVTLVLNYSNGELENQIPVSTKVVHLDGKNMLSYFPLKFRKLAINFIQFINMQKFRFEEYDLAIIGLQGLNPYFVSKCVSAKKKLHWIRNDISKCDPNNKIFNNIQKYKKNIDLYMCVSGSSLKSFNKRFPNLASKSRLFYNFLDSKEIISKSNAIEDPFIKYNDLTKILTVCRIQDKSKGVFRMLEVYDELRKRGLDFYWFIVGDGEDMNRLADKVEALGYQDKFILLGYKMNPYPYFRNADLIAVLSYYEGLCGTVNEAKILSKPLITTTFSGINEQIEHLKGGYIAENNKDSIINGLYEVLSNEQLLRKLGNTSLNERIKSSEWKFNILEEILNEK